MTAWTILLVMTFQVGGEVLKGGNILLFSWRSKASASGHPSPVPLLRLLPIGGGSGQHLKTDQTQLKSVSKEERKLRLAILHAVRDSKVKLGDYRNPELWTKNNPDIPLPGKAVAAVRDGFETKGQCYRIYCTAYAQLILLYGTLKVASGEQTKKWNKEWDGLVVPNGIAGLGKDRFWKTSLAEDEGRMQYTEKDLKPGDNIYFDNPYFSPEDRARNPKIRGEEGSNVIYAGKNARNEGLVIALYTRKVYTFTEYRRHMKETWESVKNRSGVKLSDFKITMKRSPIVMR
jgi:hypothetical protein